MNRTMVARELVSVARVLMARTEVIASVTFEFENEDYYNVELELSNNILYANFDYEKTARNGISDGRGSVVNLGPLLDVKASDVISVCQRKSRVAGFSGLDFTEWVRKEDRKKLPLAKILEVARSSLDVSVGGEYVQSIVRFERSSRAEKEDILRMLSSAPVPSKDFENLKDAAGTYLRKLEQIEAAYIERRNALARLSSEAKRGKVIYDRLKRGTLELDRNSESPINNFGLLLYRVDHDFLTQRWQNEHGFVSEAEHFDFITDLYEFDVMADALPSAAQFVKAYVDFGRTVKRWAREMDEMARLRTEFHDEIGNVLRKLV